MRFLILSVGVAALFASVMTTFVVVVDPYGVARTSFETSKFNRIKPARLGVDRLVKPMDVIFKKPKTLLMGTSRMHQAFDPTAFDGTEFAPAYNAAIPGTTMPEQARILKFLLDSNPEVEFVIFEAFIHSFAKAGRLPPIQGVEFVQDRVSLFFGLDALWDAVRTLVINRNPPKSLPRFVSQTGLELFPVDHNKIGSFGTQGYFNAVQKADSLSAVGHLDAVRNEMAEFIEIANSHGVEVFVVVFPSYPWEDYRTLSNGLWGGFGAWLSELAKLPTHVFSFGNVEGVTNEPVDPRMQYWNDPLHPSSGLGQLMIRSFLQQVAGDPDSFIQAVTADSIDAILKRRLDHLEIWVKEHPSFVQSYEANKHVKFPELLDRTPRNSLIPDLTKLGNLPKFQAFKRRVGQLQSSQVSLEDGWISINGEKFEISRNFSGWIESVTYHQDSMTLTGWAVDKTTQGDVSGLLLVSGKTVISMILPSVDRPEIRKHVAKNANLTGFRFNIPYEKLESREAPVSVFALLEDGSFARLNSSRGEVTNGHVPDFAHTVER